MCVQGKIQSERQEVSNKIFALEEWVSSFIEGRDSGMLQMLSVPEQCDLLEEFNLNQVRLISAKLLFISLSNKIDYLKGRN